MGDLRLGLRANAWPFAFLVLINAFVGATVGVERSVLPLLARAEFGLGSYTAALSFVASFGVAKALANLAAGRLGDRHGRRRVLIAGWLFGLPVPLLLMYAPSWGIVVLASLLLGVNQGLAWSAAVVMKIDLAGPRQRGLAMGLNEAAGYLAVSASALAAGYVAAVYGLRPAPFYLAMAFVIVGLVLTIFAAPETRPYAELEAADDKTVGEAGEPAFREAFRRASWSNATLFSVSQAGFVNNLNDGMAWGLLPIFFVGLGHSVGEVGALAAIYPATWGLGQLATGAISDRLGRKPLVVGGMLVQAAAILAIPVVMGFWLLAGAMALLGIGTAMVYPALLAAIGDEVHSSWRGTAVGVYRLWRDGGYVAGALLAGLAADLLGIPWAVALTGGLTAISGIVAALRMRETLPGVPASVAAESSTANAT